MGTKKNGSDAACITNKNTKGQQPSILVDYERYQHFLEDSDLSADEKIKFLETIWGIVVGFVDLGFGVHPVQQAEKACGQLSSSAGEPPKPNPSEVEWDHSEILKLFAQSAQPPASAQKGEETP